MGKRVSFSECGFWGSIFAQILPPLITAILERVGALILDLLDRLHGKPPATPEPQPPAAPQSHGSEATK